VSDGPKRWATRPSPEEARIYLQRFFDALRDGKIEVAQAMVTHAYEDWDESVFLLFQEMHLIHETPADTSFEGRGWDRDRGWLRDLSVKDGAEWMGPDGSIAWIDLAFRGNPTGHIAQFQVRESSSGWVIERQIFRMA
jgi:hypothetical protein